MRGHSVGATQEQSQQNWGSNDTLLKTWRLEIEAASSTEAWRR